MENSSGAKAAVNISAAMLESLSMEIAIVFRAQQGLLSCSALWMLRRLVQSL